MSNPNISPQIARKVIVFLLRFLGINALLAFVFILMPFSWFQAIHEWMGLGEMPKAPIVGYLTRSLCMFYALFGAILIMVSLDIDHYHGLLRFFGILFPLIGLTILGIDHHEKLPLSWVISEGPFTIIFGAIFLWLLRCHKSPEKS